MIGKRSVALVAIATIVGFCLVATSRAQDDSAPTTPLPDLTDMLEPTGVFDQEAPLDEQQERLIGIVTEIHREERELAEQERELLTDFSTETDAKLKLKVLYNLRLRNLIALRQLIPQLTELTAARRGAPPTA